MMENANDLSLSISKPPQEQKKPTSQPQKKEIQKEEEPEKIPHKKEKGKENETINYQPLTYEAYKYFNHIGPYIENVLLNNINKYILQSKSSESSESTGMSKLDKDFTFPKELLNYLFPNSQNVPLKISFRKFLFFDTKPFQMAFAIMISPKNSDPLSSIIPGPNNNSCNLIVLYSIFKSQIEHIYYSFSAIDDMVVIGETENILITAKADGSMDAYDLYNNFNKVQYYMNYENNTSIARDSSYLNNDKKVVEPKYKLILPLISTNNIIFTSQIKKFAKYVNDSFTDEKIYRIYAIDQLCHIASFNFRESSTHSENALDMVLSNPEINFDLEALIKRGFNISEDMEVECLDIKYFNDNYVLILTNFGLCSVEIEGKEHFIINAIYHNNSTTNSNNMTSFDVSDIGYIVCSFNDLSIKIYSMKNFEEIYQSHVTGLSEEAIIDKIVWSNIICKNGKGKLIRRSLLANFYLFTTKNDFVIFDLNQKKVEDIRKIKRKKELGAKQKLSRKNSIIDMSDSLFTDYSNFILQSNTKNDNEGKVEMHKLSLRKQYYEEISIKKANDKIIKKVLSLNGN